ncbi:MAG: PKD domain-containing protein [Nanoarchaeota archaeon]|nr:PKD domain-containing protein [Nanoarchaeota archaeon]
MNKLMIICSILLVILAFNVSAYADINYNFNVNNVVAEAYNCLDNGCNSVGQFSGYFPDGHSTTDGELTIVYPSSLATNYGYAVFYFAEGMLPMEGLATWHTYGDNAHYSADYNVNFFQKDVCHSTIDTFTVTNDLYANEPLIINIDASLDAETYSAFSETNNDVGYVPPAYKDEFYSADTRVTLRIKNSAGTVVNQQVKEFSAANGNPLYMSTSKIAEFTWTPTVDGTYTATVTTDVIDNQCASSEEASSAKELEVYPARPANECYTILNSLATDDPYPVINQEIEITYTKISNYADTNHVKTAIPTDVEYTIAHDSGTVVYTDAKTIPANTDTTNPSTQSFTWTPDTAGWYDLTIYGIGNSNFCSGLSNTDETITEKIYVEGIPEYNLRFQITDATTGAKIEGALVNIGITSGNTNANGEVTFIGLMPDTYSYTITHPDYITITGSAEIIDCDKDIMLTMTHTNRPPIILEIPDINMTQSTSNSDIDLDDYVIDSESDDSELTWTVSGNSHVGISIGSDHVVTFTAPDTWAGSETITFTVSDPQGSSDSDSMVVSIYDSNSAPVISGLPDITINEDNHLFDAIHLPDYAQDEETPVNLLNYSIACVSDTSCGVSLGADLNIDIQPSQDWNGACNVTIEVSDGEFTDSDTFTITVNSINDIPIITSSPITDAEVEVLYIYDVAAYDPDGDTRVYSLTTYPAGMTIDSTTGIIEWTPEKCQAGTAPVRVVVSDGLYSAEQLFIITVSKGPNQSPIVSIIADPTTGYAPLEVAFTSTVTDDGEIVSYFWNFGDGYGSNQANTTHTYPEAGTYTVTLVVTDDEGATGTDCVEIIVNETPDENLPPTASIIAGPTEGIAPLEVSFNGTGTDSDGEIVKYFWNFGDGYGSTQANTTHTYTEAGIYPATLVVTDDDGAMGTAYVIIRVTADSNIAPTVVITANPTTGNTPLDVTFTSTVTDEGEIVSYLWNFGDGYGSTEANTTHTYTTAGIYTATLVVTDDEGATGTACVEIIVNETSDENLPPTVVITANPKTGNAPLNVSFTSTVTDDGEIVSYLWNFGDGSFSGDANTTHVYTKPGTYTAVLTVTDDASQTAQSAVIIRVTEAQGTDFRWAAYGLSINKLTINNEDVLKPGDTLRVGIKFENRKDYKMDNIKVSAIISDLGVWRSKGPFTLRAGKDMFVTLEMDLPYDAEPGVYDLRVALNDNEIRRLKVRQITIED